MPGNDILVSVVSLWEVVIKVRIGKLAVDIGDIVDAVALDGFTRLELNDAHLLTLRGMPMSHRDPFNHLLIAQAITENATFISADRNTPGDPVRCVNCSG